jgi:peptidyl-tRNA hydrolase, PTH1 family
MKSPLLFIFLGNHEKKYEYTRHNAGFLFGDYLRNAWDFSAWKSEKRFFGSVSEGTKNGKKFFLLKPETFMNLSGKSVSAISQFFHIPVDQIFLFYDDKDLPFGSFRFREAGSSGGHNGVKDVLRVLGTQNVQRWKIGVDTEKRMTFQSTADFVLSRFLVDETKNLENKIFPDLLKSVAENSLFSKEC